MDADLEEEGEDVAERSFERRALCPAASEEYDEFAPTKQNLLCGGRSASEVIRSSTDFQVRKTSSRRRLILRKR